MNPHKRRRFASFHRGRRNQLETEEERAERFRRLSELAYHCLAWPLGSQGKWRRRKQQP